MLHARYLVVRVLKFFEYMKWNLKCAGGCKYCIYFLGTTRTDGEITQKRNEKRGNAWVACCTLSLSLPPSQSVFSPLTQTLRLFPSLHQANK